MFYIIAIVVGGLLLFQSIFISEVAKKVGLINSALMHYSCAMVFLVVLTGLKVIRISPDTINTAPIYAYVGALIGVFALLLLSVIIPKMSVVKSTILMFSGQIIASLIIDIIIKTELSKFKLIGVAFIGTGLILNVIFSNTPKNNYQQN